MRKERLLRKKELSSATKSFRQSSHIDLSQFRSILRSYQKEIDTLDRSLEAAESCIVDHWEGIRAGVEDAQNRECCSAAMYIYACVYALIHPIIPHCL